MLKKRQNTLEEQKEEIISELGDELFWSGDDSYADFGVRLYCEDVFAPENREEMYPKRYPII